MTTISKELLSEVLGFEVSSVYVAPNDTFVEAQSEYSDERVNIHELAHKCKEWALINHTFIESGLPYKTRATAAVFNSDEGFLEGFEADTEPEAIFKACKWLLANTKEEIK